MDYEYYTSLDFIKDEFFVRWVKKPDQETDFFWKQWLAKFPERAVEVAQARQIIQEVKYETKFTLADDEMNRVHEQIIRHQQLKQLGLLKKGGRFFPGLYGIAAGLIILLVAGLGLLNIQNKKIPDVSIKQTITYRTLKTEKGVKQTTRLSDGTMVKLNAESSIVFPEKFNPGVREVTISGEVFFDVEPDPLHPFIIRLGKTRIEVLGTSFNVNAYRKDQIRIAVLEGTVQVADSAGSEPVVVEAMNMVVINPSQSMLRLETFNLTDEIGWKDGILYFDHLNLQNVFEELERWYGVGIEVDNPAILKEKYQGEFRNQSLENVLSGIGFTSDFHFEIKEKQVFIKTRKPMKTKPD